MIYWLVSLILRVLDKDNYERFNKAVVELKQPRISVNLQAGSLSGQYEKITGPFFTAISQLETIVDIRSNTRYELLYALLYLTQRTKFHIIFQSFYNELVEYQRVIKPLVLTLGPDSQGYKDYFAIVDPYVTTLIYKTHLVIENI